MAEGDWQAARDQHLSELMSLQMPTHSTKQVVGLMPRMCWLDGDCVLKPDKSECQAGGTRRRALQVNAPPQGAEWWSWQPQSHPRGRAAWEGEAQMVGQLSPPVQVQNLLVDCSLCLFTKTKTSRTLSFACAPPQANR